MAPRKKTSKVSKQHLNKTKTAKLDAFLQDFDLEVKTVCKTLVERKNQLLKDADNAYNMALIKLPKAVRTMNWLEHYRSEHPIMSPEDKVQREEDAATVESVLAEVLMMPPITVQKTSKKRATAKTGSEDEENMGDQSTVKKGKSRKPPTTSNKAKAVGKQKTPVARSSRAPLVTPARNNTLNSSRLMGTTPLITPRFDPRLPRTPAVRSVQHKERVYSMSVNGSPIAASSDDIVINVPVGNGECVQLLASQMDSVDLSLLDENALKSIRLLQNRLTALCGPAHQP